MKSNPIFIGGRWVTDVAGVLEVYAPRFSEESWFQLRREDLTDCIARTDFNSLHMAHNGMVQLCRFARFAHEHGVGLDAETLLTQENVDWFISVGMAGYTLGSQQTTRSLLRRIARANTRKAYWPETHELGRRAPKRPYSASDIAGFLEVARQQSTAYKTRNMLAILALGVGAGLRTTEMRLVRAEHVRQEGRFVLVDVPGLKARTVPMRRPLDAIVLELAAAHPSEPLVGRVFDHSRDPIYMIRKRLDIPDRLPALDPIRLRTTWIIAALESRVPLHTAFQVSGNTRLHFDHYVPHIKPSSDPLLDLETLTEEIS